MIAANIYGVSSMVQRIGKHLLTGHFLIFLHSSSLW